MVKNKLKNLLLGTVVTGTILASGCVGYHKGSDGQITQRSLRIIGEPTTSEQRAFPNPIYTPQRQRYQAEPFR